MPVGYNGYVEGQLVSFDVTFMVGETISDPTDITFKYNIAATPNGTPGTTTTLTTTSTSASDTPSPGTISRSAVGVYTATIDTTAQPGSWTYAWSSTGVQTYKAGSIYVAPAPI